MVSWIRTWLHCLGRTLVFKPHIMCSAYKAGRGRRHFCSCGYLNKGVTWTDFVTGNYPKGLFDLEEGQ